MMDIFFKSMLIVIIALEAVGLLILFVSTYLSIKEKIKIIKGK